MDCLEARRRAATDAVARRHVQTCHLCQAVQQYPEVDRQLSSTQTMVLTPRQMAGQLQILQEALAKEASPRGWLRERPRRWVVAMAAAWTVAMVMAVAVGARRPDWSGGVPEHAMVALALGVVALICGLTLVVRPLFAPAIGAITIWTAGVVALLIAVAFATQSPGVPGSIHEAGFFLGAGRCFLFGTAFTTPLMAWMQLTRRGGRSLSANRFTGAAATALVGILCLEMHCPSLDIAHRLVGHAALGLVCGLGGLLVRR